MTTVADDMDRLLSLPGAAAELLRRSAAPQRDLEPDAHTGVLRLLYRCTPQRGDAFVTFQLLSSALPGSYEPGPGTVAEIVDVLDRFEISQTGCRHTFGPCWREVVAHAFAATDWVDDDGQSLILATADSHRRFGAWVRAHEAAAGAGRLDNWYRSQGAAWEPRFGPRILSRHTTQSRYTEEEPLTLRSVTAIRDIAAALSIADLVGQNGFTRDCFEALVAPRAVLATHC